MSYIKAEEILPLFVPSLFGFLYAITNCRRILSPYYFRKQGQEFFRKNLAIAKPADLPYIMGWNPDKGGLHFDSLCNGCISAGYARVMEY